MTARSAHVSVDPRIATRAMVPVVLVAVTMAVASLSITPQYEASVMILVGEERKIIETSNDAGHHQATGSADNAEESYCELERRTGSPDSVHPSEL